MWYARSEICILMGAHSICGVILSLPGSSGIAYALAVTGSPSEPTSSLVCFLPMRCCRLFFPSFLYHG